MEAVATAREAALDAALASWSAKDRDAFARLCRRFVDGLKAASAGSDQGGVA